MEDIDKWEPHEWQFQDYSWIHDFWADFQHEILNKAEFENSSWLFPGYLKINYHLNYFIDILNTF